MSRIAASRPAGLFLGTAQTSTFIRPWFQVQLNLPFDSLNSVAARECHRLHITASPLRKTSWLCEPVFQAIRFDLSSRTLATARSRSIGYTFLMERPAAIMQASIWPSGVLRMARWPGNLFTSQKSAQLFGLAPGNFDP